MGVGRESKPEIGGISLAEGEGKGEVQMKRRRQSDKLRVCKRRRRRDGRVPGAFVLTKVAARSVDTHISVAKPNNTTPLLSVKKLVVAT
jgi:hypothetical protein